MTLSSDEQEIQMQSTMQELLSQYQQIDQLVCSMLDKQASHKPINDDLQQLKRAQDNTTQFESDTRGERESYHKSNEQASEVVESLTQQSKSLLLQLANKIERLEKHAKATYTKLAPQIDQGVRASQMHQAYKQ